MKTEIHDGLNRLSDRVYAYMQLEGGWGANHTALFVNKGESLLIDTTCDLPRMRRMLGAMREADSAASSGTTTSQMAAGDSMPPVLPAIASTRPAIASDDSRCASGKSIRGGVSTMIQSNDSLASSSS